MKPSKLLSLFFVLLTVLAFTACSSNPSQMEDTEAAGERGISANEITVVDARGRTVTLAQPPEHIIITGRAHFMITDSAYLFPQAQDRVIALSGPQQRPDSEFLALLDPDYASKATLAIDPDVEELAALHPDVVLLKSYLTELGDALEAVNIPVVYLDLETPEQYARDLAILGLLFGDSDRADEVWGMYEALTTQMTEALKGVSEDEKPRVLLLQYSAKGDEIAFKVPPESWIQTQMVVRGGGTPVWESVAEEGGWTVVNLEQIAAWDPDQIYIINYFDDVEATVAGILSDPKWEGLKAVAEGEVYAFPKDYYSWDQPDTRWMLGLTWIAGKIQPERFAVDTEQEFYKFYETMYNLNKDVVQTHIVPLLEGDTW
ncbi:MAG: ABC transporter substrate-binding protein [Anaerolineae bacterium]|nr:ABC transporter substrate-binding protein [Anaerolineae bacterium]